MGAPHESAHSQENLHDAHQGDKLDSIEQASNMSIATPPASWPTFPLHSIENGACTCAKHDCSSPGKHPRVRHGVHEATTDPSTIEQWSRAFPGCNWAVAAGKDAGLVVVDVDPDKGGFESLATLDLPETYTVRSGGGGLHLYFRWVEGIKNRVSPPGLPGIDIRSDGGYVVAPGGRHVSGGVYTLESQPTQWLSVLPTAFVDRLRQRRADGFDANGERLPDSRSILQGVPEGQRDDTLFKWACRLRRRLNDDRGAIEFLVLEAARNSNFPEAEALKKVDQAFKQDHSDSDDNGPDGVRLTHGGNGVRFARMFGDSVTYIDRLGWHAWDGSVWRPQTDEAMGIMAKEVIDQLYTDARSRDLSNTMARAVFSFARRTDALPGISNMLGMARLDPGLFQEARDFNSDPMKLAVANGVVDLTTGDLLEASRHDFITSRSPYEYDPGARAPMWESFIRWAMRDDDELIGFVQRLAGYSITGRFDEHIFPVMIGGGQNGKNTFIETLDALLGDLAVNFPTDAVTKSQEEIKHTALLHGKRFAWMSETNRAAPINSATMKRYTGDGTLRGKYLYHDTFEFTSTHTLWFMSNHRPRIDDNSEGAWRRVLLLPWTATLTEDRKVKNYSKVMLAKEAPGILKWLVEGALRWQENGLVIPDSIRATTQEYREDEDTFGAFIRDRLVIEPDKFVSRKDLADTYEAWAEDEGLDRKDRVGRRDVARVLGERLPEVDPNYSNGSRRGLRGVGVALLSWEPNR